MKQIRNLLAGLTACLLLAAPLAASAAPGSLLTSTPTPFGPFYDGVSYTNAYLAGVTNTSLGSSNVLKFSYITNGATIYSVIASGSWFTSNQTQTINSTPVPLFRDRGLAFLAGGNASAGTSNVLYTIQVSADNTNWVNAVTIPLAASGTTAVSVYTNLGFSMIDNVAWARLGKIQWASTASTPEHFTNTFMFFSEFP